MRIAPSKKRVIYPPDLVSAEARKRHVRPFSSTARWLQLGIDCALVLGLLYLLTRLGGIPFSTDYRVWSVVTVLLMVSVYRINNVYGFAISIFNRCATLAKSWAVVLGLLIAIAFITKTSSNYSRQVFLTWALAAFIVQIMSYLISKKLITTPDGSTIPALIVGSGKLARHLGKAINDNPWIPDQVMGFIAENDKTGANDINPQIVGQLNDISTVLDNLQARRIYIAVEMRDSGLVTDIYRRLVDSHVEIIWVPDILAVDLLNYSVSGLGGVPVISFSETPLIGRNIFLKAALDLAVASTVLVLAAPIMLLTALLVKLSSPGPVLFKQQRHGWYGEVINIYKFRSMKLHDEDDGKVTQATRDDERVTWIGRIIRRTSIDELPQLFNVINGSMSVVGPRPHAVAHNQFYGEKIKDYMRRHRVKPGITGLAQVNGLRGRTQTVEAMEQRVRDDLVYINNWSIWLDFKIMIKTLFVLFGKNAY